MRYPIAARPGAEWFRPPQTACEDPMPPPRRAPQRFPDLLPHRRLLRLARRHGLTERQRQILRLLCRGLSNSEIAAELAVSVETVRKHTRVIYLSFDVSDRLELVLRLVHSEVLDHDRPDR